MVSRRVPADELRRQSRRDRLTDRIGETAWVDDRGRVHPDHAEAVVHASPVTAAMAALPSRDRELLQQIGWESAFAALAEFEWDSDRDRTSVGQAARDRGRVGGRPTTMTPAKLNQPGACSRNGTPVTEITKALSIGRATVYRHLRPGIAVSAELLPAQLRARLRDAPGLAWTVANAYTPAPAPRPGPRGVALRVLTSIWVSPRLMHYVPLVAVAIWTGGLARIDRHAPVLVDRDAPVTPSSVASLAAAVTVPAVFVFLVLWSLSVSAGQVQATAVVLGAVIMLDVATVILVRRAHGSTGPRRKELELTGAQVPDVALYAAHPRGQGHGRRLLSALLPVMPPTATLLAVAGSDDLAKAYIES